MKKLIAVLALIGCLTILAPSAGAQGKLTVLGTDPALDAPAGADLVGLAVARHGSDLHVQVQMTNALPVQGSYPRSGIEWIFDVSGRTYIAEGHPEPGGEFRYTLYEVA